MESVSGHFQGPCACLSALSNSTCGNRKSRLHLEVCLTAVSPPHNSLLVSFASASGNENGTSSSSEVPVISWMTPNNLCSLIVSVGWSDSSDFLPKNTVKQKWQKWLLSLGCKRLTSIYLHSFSGSPCLFWRRKLPCFELPYGDAHMTRTWEWALGNCQWNWGLSPTQQPCEWACEWIIPRGSLRWLQSKISPWSQPVGVPEQRTHLHCVRVLTHRNCEKINVLLSHSVLEVICYLCGPCLVMNELLPISL